MAGVSDVLVAGNALSELAALSEQAAARGNLGLGSAATQPSSAFLQAANDLSEIGNVNAMSLKLQSFCEVASATVGAPAWNASTGTDFWLVPSLGLAAFGTNPGNGITAPFLMPTSLLNPGPGKTTKGYIVFGLGCGQTPGINIKCGLYQITGVGSGNSQVGWSGANLVSGSDAYIINPTQGNNYGTTAGPFNLPTSGLALVLGCNISGGGGSYPANSSYMMSMSLFAYAS
jgi:hypothetical protein